MISPPHTMHTYNTISTLLKELYNLYILRFYLTQNFEIILKNHIFRLWFPHNSSQHQTSNPSIPIEKLPPPHPYFILFLNESKKDYLLT